MWGLCVPQVLLTMVPRNIPHTACTYDLHEVLDLTAQVFFFVYVFYFLFSQMCMYPVRTRQGGLRRGGRRTPACGFAHARNCHRWHTHTEVNRGCKFDITAKGCTQKNNILIATAAAALQTGPGLERNVSWAFR